MNNENFEDSLDFEFTVLIVEGNKKRASSLKYILDGLYLTEAVKSIEEAIAFLNKNDAPDLIISNYEFFSYVDEFLYKDEAKSTALDLCIYVKENKNSDINSIPIIVLMEGKGTKERAQLFNDGASDIVSLPYDMLELFSRIEVQLEKVNERKKLFDSIQNLLEDKKVRNRKNVDFRTKLFAKHRESIVSYEEKVIKLREQIAEKNSEIEKIKFAMQDLKRENLELFNELRYIKSQISQPEDGKKLNSNEDNLLENISDSDLGEIEILFKHVNQEHLFEESILKEITDKILSNEIDFRKVDNFSFINAIPKILKRYTKLELEEIYVNAHITEFKQRCGKYIDHLVEYLVRVYQNKFLFFLSMNLLEVIGAKDENATRFLKFYDGRVEIAPNGVRFQKPTIGGEKEGAWNMISMMQIINQRANGHKILVEQEVNIQKVNDEFEVIKRKFDILSSAENGLFSEEFKIQKPFEEKLKILEDLTYKQKKETSSKELARQEELNDRLYEINILRDAYEKNKTAKEVLMSKYSKQVSYYKPTEEKFAKVALSVAKVMLKVKVTS
jgi:CheY-like chemotaxis protein